MVTVSNAPEGVYILDTLYLYPFDISYSAKRNNPIPCIVDFKIQSNLTPGSGFYTDIS